MPCGDVFVNKFLGVNVCRLFFVLTSKPVPAEIYPSQDTSSHTAYSLVTGSNVHFRVWNFVNVVDDCRLRFACTSWAKILYTLKKSDAILSLLVFVEMVRILVLTFTINSSKTFDTQKHVALDYSQRLFFINIVNRFQKQLIRSKNGLFHWFRSDYEFSAIPNGLCTIMRLDNVPWGLFRFFTKKKKN